MKPSFVRFLSGNETLDGRYTAAPASDRAVIVTHPHPLYGGDMNNSVVSAIATAYQQCGFSVLRFNFRGVGASTGTYGEGIGEQEDVAAAVDFVRQKGISRIHLSGYSFGAWVNAATLSAGSGFGVEALTLVAPPAAVMPFPEDLRLPMLSGIIAGEQDDIAPPDLIRKLAVRWNPEARLEVIPGADHFFAGFLDAVTARVSEFSQ
ncbi:alpha/beta hydrolase [Desulfosarcina sp. OttesenSCG-928-A07]|nr:alpha/beta hydrolase [Desulfosarcina sp. OttesenSCG-928-G17]MDL2328320.1 alpha/beta hydrolase [Desulfosarcina sp. OttesenSCG-928-A07]